MKKVARISPKLEWMASYLELGMTFVSGEAFVERLGAWTLGKSRGLNCHASLFQDKIGDNYRIWLHTHYYGGEDGLTPMPFSRIDLLRSLAHEISHIEEWKHTPRHSLIESRINMAFMRMLNGEGYVSEEEELK